MSDENALYPLHVFRFQVEFEQDSLGSSGEHAPVPLCGGAFAECSGLEVTMEPKVIKEGGCTFGSHQRAGPVSFATVILRRGITTTRDLWNWFRLSAEGGYAFRLTATISMHDAAGEKVLAWRLSRALPIKFKSADLNAKGTDVGIEEVHLAHEGLSLAYP